MEERIMSTDITIIISACVSAAVFCVTWLLIRKWKRVSKKQILKKKAVECKKKFDKAIESKLDKLKNEQTETILSMNAQSLILGIQRGEILPTKVLDAYLYKSCLETKRLNCIVGFIKIDKDSSLSPSESSKDPFDFPLYGLPVSIKESLETKGMDSTVGLAANIGNPATDDCVLVKVLKHCGAVPFVKTNLSQMMLSLESNNPIFGTTLNPQNTKFTPGGSSSGEGALIGSGGSLLGFGTDTGGSIRCPSHMCGIAGFKPSRNRISTKGLKGLWGQTGPMARDVDTLVLAMRALLCPLMFELDIDVPPLPFNEELFNSKTKLRIGYYVDDGYNEPVPAIKRSVMKAKEALEKAGHTLVIFQPPRIADMMRMYTLVLFSDKTILNVLKYEEVDPNLKVLMRVWSLSATLRRILSTLIGMKYPRIGQSLNLYDGSDLSVSGLRKIESEVEGYKQEFHNAWRDNNLDAVICPPFPVVAGPLGSLNNALPVMDYAVLFNLLHYPAGIIPVTKVTEEDMAELKNYRGHYDDPWDKENKSTCEGSLGVSVGVQCVALPFRDEVCLRVMKEVESMLAH